MRTSGKLLTVVTFKIAGMLEIPHGEHTVAVAARDGWCQADGLMDFMKEKRESSAAKGSVTGRGDRIIEEMLDTTVPGGILDWMAENAVKRDLTNHEERKLALILFVVYNYAIHLHNHIVEVTKIPQDECFGDKVWALQEMAFKTLFILEHHRADWAVRLCPLPFVPQQFLPSSVPASCVGTSWCCTSRWRCSSRATCTTGRAGPSPTSLTVSGLST